jgi:multicomponent Na+:H+ antiporter subunit D
VTAVLGAVMAISQRHFKRLLAYSTIAHVGLFLVALACLTVSGTAGALLYVAGHAAVKGALFLVAGVMLAQYGSVDEYDLFGKGTGQRIMGVALVVGALGLAGLPPFGTALGKALSEDAGTTAGYPWVPVLFVAVSALTAAAVLRVAGRVYFALGPKPTEWSKARATGSGEMGEPRFERLPRTMGAAIIVLLAGGLALGVVPGAHSVANRAAATFIDSAGYAHQALYGSSNLITAPNTPNWTGLGLVLGFLSALLACVIAGMALYGRRVVDRLVPSLRSVYRPIEFLQKLHSGHVGDYVAWMMMGMTVVAGFVGLPLR